MTSRRQPGRPWSFPRRELLRGAALAAGAGLFAAGDLALPRPAGAAVSPPPVLTRADWSARPPAQPVTVLDRTPDHIVVHHMASGNTSDFSRLQAGKISHWVQDLHMDTNGWTDAGQQLTISRGGYLLEGRDQSLWAIANRKHVRGAHTANHNDHTIGIENEGIYVSQDTTTVLFDTLVQTCAWLCDVYLLDPYQAIVGHRDYNATQCPGDVLYARLPELRNRVAQLLGA